MTEELIAKMLANVGVPAALCFYVLFKVNQSVEQLTDAVKEWNKTLSERIKDLENDIRDLKRKEV